ncbi:hypothetical protein CONPUDRAFT_40076, partial [Coniophora puteana RWD-64-598 SS2]
DHDVLEPVHSFLWMNCSDLPSLRRTNACQSHSSKLFMCSLCENTSFSLVHPSCFDPALFKAREDWRHIKYSFRSRDADEEGQQIIREHRGVSWTPLNYLAGWQPAGSAALDFMHCVFLTMVKHVTKVIIYSHGLLNPTRGANPLERLETFFEELVWPPEVTRMPPSISIGKGSVKADQWRNLINVLFVGLYVAWQHDARLRQYALAQNALTPPEVLDQLSNVKPDRNLRRHYDVLLEFTVAVRILGTREISPRDVQRGSAALSRSTQAWASMHIPLTPYWHFGQHLGEQLYKYGPTYGHWTFPYEQHNAKLLRFKHNHHKGGELECTLMRRW